MPRDDVYHPGTPVDLPVEHKGGRTGDEYPDHPNRRTHVATELGVEIYFDAGTRDFRARVHQIQHGRGGSAELHSADFGEILERIRERALVVPVKGYAVATHESRRAGEDPVELEPVEVIEYHPTRNAPFVVRYHGRAYRAGRWHEGIQTRQCGQVYVPTPEQVDDVRRAMVNLIATKARHAEELDAANRAVAAARERLTTLDRARLKHVQQTGQQAIDPSGLGLPVFTMEEDDDDANDDPQE